MLKQSLLALLASLIVIVLAVEIAFLLHLLDHLHLILAGSLSKIFAGGTIGSVIRHTIALFLIPFFIALIPALIYRLVTKKTLQYFPHILWVSWIVLATIIIIR